MTHRGRTGDILRAAPAAACLAGLVLLALSGVVRSSLDLAVGEPWSRADAASYSALAGDPLFWESVVFTAWLTVAATLVSVIVALPLVVALRGRGRSARALALSSVPVPHLLVGVVVVAWLGPGGLVDRVVGAVPVDLVRDEHGVGVIAVYVLKEAPFIAMLALASWTDDVRDREEAAAALGAGGVRRFAWVVWPAIRAAVATGAALAALFVLGAFEVPLVIGPNAPQTLSEMALAESRSSGLAGQAASNALLALTSAVAIAMGACAAWFIHRAGRGRR